MVAGDLEAASQGEAILIFVSRATVSEPECSLQARFVLLIFSGRT